MTNLPHEVPLPPQHHAKRHSVTQNPAPHRGSVSGAPAPHRGSVSGRHGGNHGRENEPEDGLAPLSIIQPSRQTQSQQELQSGFVKMMRRQQEELGFGASDIQYVLKNTNLDSSDITPLSTDPNLIPPPPPPPIVIEESDIGSPDSRGRDVEEGRGVKGYKSPVMSPGGRKGRSLGLEALVETESEVGVVGSGQIEMTQLGGDQNVGGSGGGGGVGGVARPQSTSISHTTHPQTTSPDAKSAQEKKEKVRQQQQFELEDLSMANEALISSIMTIPTITKSTTGLPITPEDLNHFSSVWSRLTRAHMYFYDSESQSTHKYHPPTVRTAEEILQAEIRHYITPTTSYQDTIDRSQAQTNPYRLHVTQLPTLIARLRPPLRPQLTAFNIQQLLGQQQRQAQLFLLPFKIYY